MAAEEDIELGLRDGVAGPVNGQDHAGPGGDPPTTVVGNHKKTDPYIY